MNAITRFFHIVIGFIVGLVVFGLTSLLAVLFCSLTYAAASVASGLVIVLMSAIAIALFIVSIGCGVATFVTFID